MIILDKVIDGELAQRLPSYHPNHASIYLQPSMGICQSDYTNLVSTSFRHLS